MLIGARNYLWGGGKKPKTAADYISNGLVALWDGIENGGWGVHSTTRTTWKELTGVWGYNLSIGARIWADNGLVYAAGNAVTYSLYQGHPKVQQTLNGSNPATIEFVINPSSSTATRSGGYVVFGLDDTNTGYYSGSVWYLPYNGNFSGSYNLRWNSATYKISIPTNKATCVSQVASGSGTSWTIKGYKNGTLYHSPSATQSFKAEGNRYMSLGNPAGFVGTLHCVRVYSRALTADEVAQNYAIDKERFGL